MCDPGVWMLRAVLRAPGRTAESRVTARCAGRGGRAVRPGLGGGIALTRLSEAPGAELSLLSPGGCCGGGSHFVKMIFCSQPA